MRKHQDTQLGKVLLLQVSLGKRMLVARSIGIICQQLCVCQSKLLANSAGSSITFQEPVVHRQTPLGKEQTLPRHLLHPQSLQGGFLSSLIHDFLPPLPVCLSYLLVVA